MTTQHMQTLLDICAALSAERDREALLSRILDAAMDRPPATAVHCTWWRRTASISAAW